jgi:hypothetical protein
MVFGADFRAGRSHVRLPQKKTTKSDVVNPIDHAILYSITWSSQFRPQQRSGHRDLRMPKLDVIPSRTAMLIKLDRSDTQVSGSITD